MAAYADNPFMERQYQPVPMQYAGWFRHEIRSIYEQLRTAGVPVRETITEQQRVISWQKRGVYMGKQKRYNGSMK